MRQRVTPSFVLALTALFVALGGTAEAVVERVAPQARCANGAVKGAVQVDADPNFPDNFTAARVRLAFNCAGGGVQARRVAQGVYDVRFPLNSGRLLVGNPSNAVSNPTALLHDTFLSWDSAPGGAYRVFLYDSGGNAVDADFALQLF